MLNRKKVQALMLSAVMVLGTLAGPSAAWADETVPVQAVESVEAVSTSEDAETDKAAPTQAEVTADLNGEAEGTEDPQPEKAYEALVYIKGSGSITVPADTIKSLMESAEEQTLSFNSKEVTARFVKVTDLLAAAGIEMSDGLHGLSFNTETDANSYSMEDIGGTGADPFDGMYLYRMDGEKCTYRTAKNGSTGMYWWTGVVSITEQTDHVYTWQKKPTGHYGCGMCGKELSLTVTDIDGSETVINDSKYEELRSTAEEQTFTYSSKGNVNSITSNFVKASDVLKALGNIDLQNRQDVCKVAFSDAAGYTSEFLVKDLYADDPVCLFIDSKYGNMYRTAVNNGAGNQYTKYVENIELISHERYFPGTDEDSTGWYCSDCGAYGAQDYRCFGSNRYATALAAADLYAGYKEAVDKDAVSQVILTSGKNFPDALSASALACTLGAPIVIIDSDSPDKVIDHLKENLSDGGKVTIVGGSDVVSDTVEAALKKSFKVERLQGSNRYDTNLEVLNKLMEIEASEGILIISSGKGYADSLSASSSGCPLLLVGDNLTANQTAWLKEHKFADYVILGGNAAITDEVEKNIDKITGKDSRRIGGANRYETSALIADFFYADSKFVTLACGNNFPDALVAGPVANLFESPVVLVTNERYEEAAKRGYEADLIMGGTAGIVDDTVHKIVPRAAEKD